MTSRTTKAIFIFLFFQIASISFLSAIDITQLKFNVIDIKNGLSQNSVTDIYQDSKGYMWFCTDDGLNRYDGYDFLKFDKQIDNPNSIISNFTSCIVESSPGVFWIGTEKGLSIYFYELNKFLNIESPAQIKKLIRENETTVWAQTLYSLYKIRLLDGESKKNEYSVSV